METSLNNRCQSDCSLPPRDYCAELKRAREAVENIEKFLAGDFTDVVKKYQIGGADGGSRSVENYSMSELMQLLDYWRKRCADLERIVRGRRRPNIRYTI